MSNLSPQSPAAKNPLSVTSLILGALSLFADLIALGQLAYTVIIRRESENLVLRLVTIILVFFLGWGLGYIGLKTREKSATEKILYVYLWAYLLLACISYLGVVRQLRDAFTFFEYITYVVIIAIQLAAFLVLLRTIKTQFLMPFALSLMTTSVIHALIFLSDFVFVDMPGFWFVLGEWLLWLAWNLYAFPMLRGAAKASGLHLRFR